MTQVLDWLKNNELVCSCMLKWLAVKLYERILWLPNIIYTRLTFVFLYIILKVIIKVQIIVICYICRIFYFWWHFPFWYPYPTFLIICFFLCDLQYRSFFYSIAVSLWCKIENYLSNIQKSVGTPSVFLLHFENFPKFLVEHWVFLFPHFDLIYISSFSSSKASRHDGVLPSFPSFNLLPFPHCLATLNPSSFLLYTS